MLTRNGAVLQALKDGNAAGLTLECAEIREAIEVRAALYNMPRFISRCYDPRRFISRLCNPTRSINRLYSPPRFIRRPY